MYEFHIDIHPATELSEDGKLAFLIVSLISCRGGRSVKLLQVVLEHRSQIDWFVENEDSIRNEELPIRVEGNCSIAEVIEQFYENIDPDSDQSDLLDCIYNYRQQHGVRFAFRGQNIVDAYIGLNHGKYEVSCSENSSQFEYEVDIDSFFEQLKKALEKYKSLINT